MRGLPGRALIRRGALACGAAGIAVTWAMGSPLSEGMDLYRQKRLAEAKGVLEPLARAPAPDPLACYYLAMTLEDMGGPRALDQAQVLLDKATRLAPDNEAILSEYGGVCLLLADRDNSLTMALAGRNAMVRAIAENPADLDAREGLMTFYAQAPWPLGDADRAFDQAAAIAKGDPKRGLAAYRKLAGIFQKAGKSSRAESAQLAAQNLARGQP